MAQPFPSISPFLELVDRARQNPQKIILRDHSARISATAGQLLHSVSLLRSKLQAILLKRVEYNREDESSENFIFLVAPPGWEYVVSMLTIFSLGAAMSAQSIVITPEELKRLILLANPIAILYSPSLTSQISATEALCTEENSGVDPNLDFVEISTDFPKELDSHYYELNTIVKIDPAQTGTLFFTSGTSGNQKGVVHTYQALLASARERIGTWKLTDNDVVLNQKPANWMGGIFGILPSLISGACLETCAGAFNPSWFWERISQGGVSVFDIAPTGYDRLASHFDEHISSLPLEKQELYIQEMINARVAGVSGSLLQPHTQKRWTELRRGKPLLNLYGSTEVTLICGMQWENPNYADMCSVGPPVPGVEVKLVDGEMRLKAPSMFSRYLSNDPAQTTKAFDEEGYFKTGDCAEKVGECYTLYGRANIDVLHFWGITIHTGETERALFSLPYIANAVVLPLEDDQYQERCAAILQIKPDFKMDQPDINTLRKNLTEKTGLMLFKHPTVVYWLREDEEISLTANGKIAKVDARKKFFGEEWWVKKGVEVLDLKSIEYWRMGGQC